MSTNCRATKKRDNTKQCLEIGKFQDGTMVMSASLEVETLRADCPPINSFALGRSCIFFPK